MTDIQNKESWEEIVKEIPVEIRVALAEHASKQFLEGIKWAKMDEYRRCLSVLNRDHTKCALPQTCIGYGNARSDLENNPPIINTPR